MDDILKLFDENQSVLLLEDVTNLVTSNENNANNYLELINQSLPNIDLILQYCNEHNYNVYILCYQKEQLNILNSCSKYYITPEFITYNDLEDMIDNKTELINSCFIDYKCFRKCSNKENKTYQTIVNSKQLFTKCIFIDTIGENYFNYDEMNPIFGLVGYDDIKINHPNDVIKILEDNFLYNKIVVINNSKIVKNASKYIINNIPIQEDKSTWLDNIINKIKQVISSIVSKFTK